MFIVSVSSHTVRNALSVPVDHHRIDLALVGHVEHHARRQLGRSWRRWVSGPGEPPPAQCRAARAARQRQSRRTRSTSTGVVAADRATPRGSGGSPRGRQSAPPGAGRAARQQVLRAARREDEDRVGGVAGPRGRDADVVRPEHLAIAGRGRGVADDRDGRPAGPSRAARGAGALPMTGSGTTGQDGRRRRVAWRIWHT